MADKIVDISTGKREPMRRVTGSSNIELSAEGREQAKQMARQYSQEFDHVFSSPEDRSVETAEQFGDPIILKGLDAWRRGALEGKSAQSVNGIMRSLILKPDLKPPGVSSLSKLPGESYNEFLKPLLHVCRALKEHLKTDERVLVVTSGGDLQAIDHLAADDFPAEPDKSEYVDLAKKPYWSATGQLFLLSENGLKKVADNADPGLYFIEHAATDFNPPQPKSKTADA